MPPYGLNEDHQLIQEWAHEFAESTIRPVAYEYDEREETPWDVIEEAAKIGLYSWDFIEQGFLDPAGLTLAIAIEELFWGDAGIGLSIVGSTLGGAGIAASGTPEQLTDWLPQCFGTPGDLGVAAFCVSEADAGSDVSGLRTHAQYDAARDEWIINGTKSWITNGGITERPCVHVVVAAVERELGARGQASFIIPPGTPGLSLGRKYHKAGIRASHTGEVVLDNVRVPGCLLLGGKDTLDERLARAREGKSSSNQAAMATFGISRPLVGAQAVGVARAAYEYALDYATKRTTFGVPIVEHQAVAFMLADMATRVDMARLLVWRACGMANSGAPHARGEGSMAKLVAGETAVSVTDDAVQILGAVGYMKDCPVERWRRDAKIYTIFEGTSEIQRLIIARAISGHKIH